MLIKKHFFYKMIFVLDSGVKQSRIINDSRKLIRFTCYEVYIYR